MQDGRVFFFLFKNRRRRLRRGEPIGWLKILHMFIVAKNWLRLLWYSLGLIKMRNMQYSSFYLPLSFELDTELQHVLSKEGVDRQTWHNRVFSSWGEKTFQLERVIRRMATGTRGPMVREIGLDSDNALWIQQLDRVGLNVGLPDTWRRRHFDMQDIALRYGVDLATVDKGLLLQEIVRDALEYEALENINP